MVQKYQQSMPLYRQEREWKEIGIPLSRATRANWVIRPAEDWLMPLVSRLQQDLLQQDVIHADETPVQVHKEKGRKNWLFSDSPKGAKASAAVYSIIETAKANDLNPFQYLKYLFEHLPNADIQRHPEHLDDVLPWNEIIQQNCK
ncbi:IS66 family transposase [Mitsuokella multacida]|uniref:IS66 family transposase n=1 Tax=Mitsuokella multacida TaxID=52226 RepID=UPI003D088232